MSEDTKDKAKTEKEASQDQGKPLKVENPAEEAKPKGGEKTQEKPPAETGGEQKAPAGGKKEEGQKKPPKPEKVRPTNCAGCNKQFKYKHWFYKNGQYFCTKRCWKKYDAQKKKEAAEKAAKEAEEKEAAAKKAAEEKAAAEAVEKEAAAKKAAEGKAAADKAGGEKTAEPKDEGQKDDAGKTQPQAEPQDKKDNPPQ